MMTTEPQQGTSALVAKLADEIIERLDESYDLVYVAYNDRLGDEQVAKLVRNDDEWLEASFEWESDQRYDSARDIIKNLARAILDEWSTEADDADLDFVLTAFDLSDDEERVREEIYDRDKSDWPKQLARLTPDVILRINVIDEDHGYSYEEVSPERVLVDLGLPLPATQENVEIVNDVLNETSPEFSVLLGYWIVGADVEDIYEMPYDTKEVEITNPYLYLGNPFTGSGFISERPLQATVRVKREDLRTDKDAFGYSVDEIYGGLYASSFEAKLQAVK